MHTPTGPTEPEQHVSEALIRQLEASVAGTSDTASDFLVLLRAGNWKEAEQWAQRSGISGLPEQVASLRHAIAAEVESRGTEAELMRHRLVKMERIRARGDDPYKYAYRRSHAIGEARAALETLESAGIDEANPPSVQARLAGRLVARRAQGKTTFADIRDESGRIQVFLGLSQVGEAAYESTKDFDIGDFIGVEGKVRRARRGEITVFVERFEMLAKSLRAAAEKYHGLSDVETRYRRRYMDMVANPEVLDVFRKRIQIVQVMREWLIGHGFLEVETPMLHPIPGGATARPFITHHNAYDQDFYLRVAPELYLKRLLVGGFERVFEINRCFRNEGVDGRHNPEFTTLELYEAYQEYMGLMDKTEDMLAHTIENVAGGKTISYQGKTIDITRPWKRLPLFEAIRMYAGIDLEPVEDRREAARLAESAGVEISPEMDYGKIVDKVLSEKAQPRLAQPVFLYDYPIELSPLAKKKAGNPRLTERFQPFIACLEVGNAFSELNDPIDQRKRFEAQAALREAGDDEAQYLDEDFIFALEIGMPPAAGLGIGIDRLAMLVTDSPSIRDVILFPQLRPGI